MAVPPGFELLIHVGAFGIRSEECGVFLRGNIEVLIDLSAVSKLQFQHLLLRSIADAGDTAGVYWNSLHAMTTGVSLSAVATSSAEKRG